MEYRRIVRFYDRYEGKILKLDFDEYFEMVILYTNALFETGEYQKHLLMADVVIETSILQNIPVFGNLEIYHATLFKKAASFYNLKRYPEAIHILKELIKMNPKEVDNIKFLEKCFQKVHSKVLKNCKAIGMFLLLVTVFVIMSEILIIRHWYPNHTHQFEISRNTLFVAGLLALCSGYLHYYLSAYLRALSFRRQIK
jgi:tetratricopeptide (TPR) repeat protein